MKKLLILTLCMLGFSAQQAFAQGRQDTWTENDGRTWTCFVPYDRPHTCEDLHQVTGSAVVVTRVVPVYQRPVQTQTREYTRTEVVISSGNDSNYYRDYRSDGIGDWYGVYNMGRGYGGYSGYGNNRYRGYGNYDRYGSYGRHRDWGRYIPNVYIYRTRVRERVCTYCR